MHQESLNQPQRIRISARVTLVQRGRRGLWSADFHQAGVHRRRSLGTANRRVAEQRARDFERDLLTGSVLHTLKPMGIEEAIGLFVDFKRINNRSSKTLVKYETELKTLAEFAKARGVRTVDRITLSLVDAYQKHRKETDGLEPYSIYTHAVIMKTWAKWLRKRKHIASDPLVDLEVEKPARPRHPAATIEQVNAILLLAGGHMLAVLATAAFTGLRIGEVANLRVGDVDLAAGIISVRQRRDWRPKTDEADRAIPIHQRLLVILKAYDQQHPLGRKRGFFFTAPPSHRCPLGDRPINVRTANVVFQTLASKNGFVVGRENLGLTEHAMRRFFKTTCLDASVPQALVDLWMGHSRSGDMNTHYYRPQKQVDWMSAVPFGEPDHTEAARLGLEPERRRPGRPRRSAPTTQVGRE